jgi:beta-lactamase regulating signal transducer with metallopeptidase domain
MSAKIRKIIWFILTLQLYLFHGWLITLLPRLKSSYALLLIVLWISVAAIILLIYILQYYRFRNACYRSILPAKNAAMAAALNRTGSKHLHTVYCSDYTISPFVTGFHKPILIVPNQYGDDATYDLIFAHENQHIVSLDNWYKLFLLVTQCLLWYQPLSYILKHIGIMDIEIACDEAIVKDKSPSERASYGQLLINSLRIQQNHSKQIWSSYFYDRKSVLKKRISAIMEPERKWDHLAIAASIVLLCETVFLFSLVGRQLYTQFDTAIKPTSTANIYDGYSLPESFNDSALSSMLSVSNVNNTPGDYTFDTENNLPIIPYEEIRSTASGPWQVRINGGCYYNCIAKLLTRYLYYYEDQQQGSLYNPELMGGTETISPFYEIRLAGNSEDSVYYIVGRELLFDKEISPELKSEGAVKAHVDDIDYAYYSFAVHIKKTADYVYELVGIVNGETALQAFTNQYTNIDYTKVAHMDIDSSVLVSGNTTRTIHAQLLQNELKISTKEGTTDTVPVDAKALLDRGDEMAGKLNDLQSGSYQTDDQKVIFAYGGSRTTPVTVTYQLEDKTWKTTIVSNTYQSVRNLFISFPTDSQTGYLCVTSDRTMHQESCSLFKTSDGGASWQEVGVIKTSNNTIVHSLTMDMGFTSANIGFTAIDSSKQPELWYTNSNGNTWSSCSFDTIIDENYCIASAPVMEDGVLTVYIGMENPDSAQSQNARYISTDNGATWHFASVVIRR